ncbi:DUF2986 domain-containing protein [Shewanella sp. UCD-KL21]|uniref:DUF2986 domain-containing protein n=1 Tax=Shewanella sp. UCD-KL21 TaxID=1917164 RepID=UPI000970C174|nr:DUF2986 domain-containing protein [Shewanella sp. UCD-KL21]
MNRKQLMIKKTAKRAKAKKNKITPDNPQKNPKVGYISKAERARIALEEEQQLLAADNNSVAEVVEAKENTQA